MAYNGTEQPRTNWAGNFTYSTNQVSAPQTVEELQAVVRQAQKIRGLGSRHSFNSIADSPHGQIALNKFNKVLDLNRTARTVTVEGGITYGQLSPYLHAEGFALHNLASLPHISIAGACATATHGSGLHHGNLATAVVGLELVDAQGELRTFTPQTSGEAFNGAVVSLGCLGLVTKLTLRIEPTFQVQQSVYLDLPMDVLATDFEAVMGSGYSVSLFTDWQTERLSQVWIKEKTENKTPIPPAAAFCGATLAAGDRHPLPALSAQNCTPQGGIPGPWHERLPHFRMGFTPSSGNELQSEYFVPLERAYEAIRAVATLGPQLAPHLFISEIRTIAADTLWLSPHYQRASVALHFTWKPDWPAVRQLLPLLESKLAPFDVLPHWGKLFTLSPRELRPILPRLADFKALVSEYDPTGKFSNDFVQRLLWD